MIHHMIIVKRVAEEINWKRQLKIGIVDADLIGRDKHRFPNLVCEKISAYYKEKGARVDLLLDYENFKDYDHIYQKFLLILLSQKD